MSKALIRLLIGLGLLFVLLGFASKAFLLIGLLLLIFVGFLGVGPDGILRKEQPIDNWTTMIVNTKGHAERIFNDTLEAIKEKQVASIEVSRQAISASLVKGLMGSTRDYLVVCEGQNFKLKPYQIFINARDYGNNTDIAWHLTYKPTVWQSIAALLPFASIASETIRELDFFDEQDLRAYSTVVHHSLLDAVDKLMGELNQDSSKINRTSRGFLGIS